MSRYIIKPSGAEHDEELAEMSKIGMPGMISLALEKSPSYLRAMQLSCEKPEVYVCIDSKDNSIVGSFSLGERRRACNGQWKAQRYFSDLRIVSPERGSRILFYIMKFIAETGLLKEGEVAETIIFADNHPMIRYAETSGDRNDRLGITPVCHFGHNYLTYTLSARTVSGKSKTTISVRKAAPEDVDSIRSYYEQQALRQDSSHYIDWDALGSGHYAGLQIEDFRVAYSGDRISGIMAAWDQSSLKRIRIIKYQKPLSWFRPLVNFMSPLSGTIPLPPAGSCLNVLSVTGVCIANNNVAVFEALLHAHLKQLKSENPHRYLQIGLDETSPFNVALKSIRQKHITTGKIFYVTRNRKKPRIPQRSHLEVGRI